MKANETELSLLRPLWAASPLSARELHDKVGADLGWSLSSTRKTLDRMAAKGLVTTETRHGVKVFLPATPKLATVAAAIANFSRNVLGSKTPPPAAAFVGSDMVEESEIAELDALLARLIAEQDAEGGRE